MLFFMLFITVSSVAILIPVWVKTNRVIPQSSLLFAVTPFSLTLWTVLASQGIGGQTLAHGLEMLGIALITLVASFLKLLVWDKDPAKVGKTLAWVGGISVVSVFVFRLAFA